MKPVITLEGYKITKLLKEIFENDIEDIDHPFNMELEYSLADGEPYALLSVIVNLYLSNTHYNIEVEGIFLIDDENFSEDEIEEFVRVNGTAILYPYIRSTISTISSLDSEDTILLPTLNTQVFKNKEKFEQ